MTERDWQIYQAAASLYNVAVDEESSRASKEGYATYIRMEACRRAINIAVMLLEEIERRSKDGPLKWEPQ